MSQKSSKSKTTPTAISSQDAHIVVTGARTHNLKNINVTMPRNKLIAVTGLSGSGKSSLAFDTIFAEGQRRYIESLSPYARQFLNQMPKPDVEEITGLSPAIAIDQKSASRNPRSTVATITEIYDYLRVLYARVGRPYSPISGAPVKKLTVDQIIDVVEKLIADILKTKDAQKDTKSVMGVVWNDSKIQITAPVVRGRKGEFYQMLYDKLSEGYLFARIDDVQKNLREKIVLAKNKKHDISLVVDEFAFHEQKDDPQDFRMRLAEAVEKAIGETNGLVEILALSGEGKEEQVLHRTTLSAKFVSVEDGFSFPEIEPRLFSFNSPYGACEHCKGLGRIHLFGNEHDDICEVCHGARVRKEAGFVLLGSNSQAEKYAEKVETNYTSLPEWETNKTGTELKKGSDWKRPGINIFEFTQLTIADAHEFIMGLDLTKAEMDVAGILLNEIESRLQFMIDVGLDYLSLNRRANTLSGGEAQRIRLASQLGSKLVGALYVLDEPTIGLHQRDNNKLIETLKQLRDLGNTIIVVEHDEDTIRAADYIVEIGPGAGRFGGEVVVQGKLQELLDAKTNSNDSRTLAYLREEEKIETPEVRRNKDRGKLKIKNAKVNNLKNISVDIPLGRMVGIAGISGSGKSTFLYQVLHQNLRAKYERKYRSNNLYNVEGFEGDDSINRVLLIDQKPIGRTPRSNPATYTGAWTFIREIFSATSEARLRGWKPSRFSFNVKGGRCENCQGRGEIAVEMHFLPTVFVECDVCHGKRFEKETLAVKYKGKSVYDVLQMSIEQAAEFFKDIPAIYDRLGTLQHVGLDYLKLGQPANTLSGGESQRVKIASELYRPMTQRTVYLLDEPTVGLHFDDVKRLIKILNVLVDRGNTVILIEHNLDVIKTCDYVMDFGPEGGSGGGEIVAKGTPEQLAQNERSHTGKYLKKML